MFRKISIILVGTVMFFGVSEFSFATMCGGHNRHQQTTQAEHTEHKHTKQEAVTQVIPKEAVNVGNKICPVSGDKIDEKTKATYEYEGKIYNFCCTMCIDEFKKDAQKYIKKVEEELQAQSNGEKQEMNTVWDSQKNMDMHGGHHH